MQFFLVSENGLIVGDFLSIRLYHIPELRAVGGGSELAPVWSWLGNSPGYCGTFYKTASPYPALWVQGVQVTHTLEFDVDESGCFPVVVDHHFTEGLSAYNVGSRLKLQGRKRMSFGVIRGGEIVLNTGVLGKPETTRQLRAQLPGVYELLWSSSRDEVKYTDLDEVTGRIMIAVGLVPRCRRNSYFPRARRLCLADLVA